MRRLLREERGSALTVFAVMLPIFILFLALALDVGNWFTHKRQLQNRADSAALAAGVEYATNNLANLVACRTGGAAATTAATAITNVAKNYAGDPNPAIPGTKRNTEIGNQGSLTVAVNSSSFGGADDSDGGNPCFNHAANGSDFISPKGGYWTDVRVKETNIPTFFGTFGINVPAINARARVEVRSIGSLNPNGPRSRSWVRAVTSSRAHGESSSTRTPEWLCRPLRSAARTLSRSPPSPDSCACGRPLCRRSRRRRGAPTTSRSSRSSVFLRLPETATALRPATSRRSPTTATAILSAASTGSTSSSRTPLWV